MSSNANAKLKALASSVLRERADPDYLREAAEWAEILRTADPVLAEFHREGTLLPHRHPSLQRFAEDLILTPGLEQLAPIEGKLDPLIVSAAGGSRVSPTHLFAGLFSSAFQRIYALRLPTDEDTFIATVLEGFEELRRATSGEKVTGRLVFGVSGIKLADGKELRTPWGIVRPGRPGVLRAFGPMFQPVTQCVLVEERRLTVKFSRDESPSESVDPAETATANTYLLLPLACALASPKVEEPLTVFITWTTVLLPFAGAFGYGMSFLPSPGAFSQDVTSEIYGIEKWCQVVNSSHVQSVDVAARRLVSAIGHRRDRADALIDAVTVWENIFGTDHETGFRVTASLAKALEPDVKRRFELRKSLGKIYGMRSAVVHGASVREAELIDASKIAVEVALKIISFSYARGKAWLSTKSTDRVDTMLLEEP